MPRPSKKPPKGYTTILIPDNQHQTNTGIVKTVVVRKPSIDPGVKVISAKGGGKVVQWQHKNRS